VVVEDNRLTTLDEDQILTELAEYLPEFQKHYAEIEALNRAYEPHLEQVCSRCAAQDIGLNRYSSAPDAW
jgi:5-methylthioadenosine/S-adenosylhomocysteine deaminase